MKGNETGPIITVTPDPSKEIDRVEIFYSQDPNGQFRFNRSAEVIKQGNVYTASAPITSANLGFFAMANVYYEHPEELDLHGPWWHKNPACLYIISSNVQKFEIAEVQKAQPAVTDVTTHMIQETFENDGKPDWYRYSRDRLNTRKIRDPNWRGPIGAALSIEILDPIGENLLMEFSFNRYSKYGREFPSGEFFCVVPVEASPYWQTIEIHISDLRPKKTPQHGMPADWQTLDHLTVANKLDVIIEGERQTFKSNSQHGQSRQMRHLQWVGGEYPQTILMNGGGLELSPAEYEQKFNRQIEVSVDLKEKIDGVKKASK